MIKYMGFLFSTERLQLNKNSPSASVGQCLEALRSPWIYYPKPTLLKMLSH